MSKNYGEDCFGEHTHELKSLWQIRTVLQNAVTQVEWHRIVFIFLNIICDEESSK